MDFKDYQNETHKYFVQDGIIDNKDMIEQKLLLSRLALGVPDEAGEVAGKVKKYLRGDYNIDVLRADLIKEIGDVLWYLSELSSILCLDLEDIAKKNLDKLEDRRKRNKLRGNGDNR